MEPMAALVAKLLVTVKVLGGYPVPAELPSVWYPMPSSAPSPAVANAARRRSIWPAGAYY